MQLPELLDTWGIVVTYSESNGKGIFIDLHFVLIDLL